MTDGLAGCKARLSQALGANSEKYWDLLRRWFRHKMTKEEFDCEARELLGKAGAILAHCQMPRECLTTPAASTCTTVAQSTPPAITESSSSATQHDHPVAGTSHGKFSRVARRVSRPKGVQGFVRARPYALRTRTMRKPGKRIAAAEAASWTPSSQPVLPDIAGLRARLLSHAWSVDLQSVSSEVPELMAVAMEHHLKDILTAAVSRSRGSADHQDQITFSPLRRSNRVRTSRGQGTELSGRNLHSHVRTQRSLACEDDLLNKHGQPVRSLTVSDLLRAFQVDQRVLRSHHVRMPTVQMLQARVGRHAPKSYPGRRRL